MTFIEPVLGLAPGNPELLREHLHKKALEADPKISGAKLKEEMDVATVDEQVEEASTVFPKDDKGPFFWDYQLRGFFKESLFALIELGDPLVDDLSKWSYKKAVGLYLFVNPRRIHTLDGSGQHQAPVKLKPEECPTERPLRGQTPQGERIALARSEALPVGTTITFEVVWLVTESKKKTTAVFTENLICACLDYGALHGFAQWRSAGWGRYTWQKVGIDSDVPTTAPA